MADKKDGGPGGAPGGGPLGARYSEFSQALRDELSQVLNRVVLGPLPGWHDLCKALGLTKYAEDLDLVNQPDPTARLMEIWETVGPGVGLTVNAFSLMETLQKLEPIPRYDVISILERHLGARFEQDPAAQRVDAFASGLEEAACRGDIGEIKRMIAAEKKFSAHDLEDRNWYPVHSAAHYGHPLCTKFLVEECGFDVFKRNRQGKTAREWAELRRQSECVSILADLEEQQPRTELKKTSFSERKSSEEGQESSEVSPHSTPETTLTSSQDSEGLERSESISAARTGSTSAARGSTYESLPSVTTLDDVVRMGDIDELRIRLERGEDPSSKCGPGGLWTALHAAVDVNNIDCVTVLLEHNADIDQRNYKYYTPEEWAIFLNRKAIANLLFEEKIKRLQSRGYRGILYKPDGDPVPLRPPAAAATVLDIPEEEINIFPPEPKIVNKKPNIPEMEVEVLRPDEPLPYVVEVQPNITDMLEHISDCLGLKIVSLRDVKTKARLGTIRAVVNLKRVLACTSEDEQMFPQAMSDIHVNIPNLPFEQAEADQEGDEVKVIPRWKNFRPSVKVIIKKSVKNMAEVLELVRKELDIPAEWLLETKTYRRISSVGVLRRQRKVYVACKEDYQAILKHLESTGPPVRRNLERVETAIDHPKDCGIEWIGQTRSRDIGLPGGVLFQHDNATFIEVPDGAVEEDKQLQVDASICRIRDDQGIDEEHSWLVPVLTHCGPMGEFISRLKSLEVSMPHNVAEESLEHVKIFRTASITGRSVYCLNKVARNRRLEATSNDIGVKIREASFVGVGCPTDELASMKLRYAILGYVPANCFTKTPPSKEWTAKIFIIPDLPHFYTEVLREVNANGNLVLQIVPQTLILRPHTQHIEMTVTSTELGWNVDPMTVVVSSDTLTAHLSPRIAANDRPFSIDLRIAYGEQPDAPFLCQLTFSVVNNATDVENGDFLDVEIRPETTNPEPVNGLLAQNKLVRALSLRSLAAASDLLDPVDMSDCDWTMLADLLGFSASQKEQFAADDIKSPSQSLLNTFSRRNGTQVVLSRALFLLRRFDVCAELGFEDSS